MKEIVPEQNTGTPIDTVSSVELSTPEEAKKVFEVVKEKLQNVNEWHTVAGALSANFQLVAQTGEEVNRPAEKGDYFKISIPGPGHPTDENYDWVQIEEVEDISEENIRSFGFRVRPAQDPLTNSDETAHFYSAESTSSFTVTCENNKVTVGVYDRNTKANKEGQNLPDKIRNAIVGTTGILVFSKIQWKSLTDGLLKQVAK